MKSLKIETLKFLWHPVFFLLLIILYTLQTTPELFMISGVRPVLIVPFILCVAMLKGEGVGAIYAIIAGFLWDMSSGRLAGFSALILMLCCVAAALLTIYLIRITWFNIILITSLTLTIYFSLDYMFFYLLWNYENSHTILINKIIPMCIYTIIISPFMYLLLNKINKKFAD